MLVLVQRMMARENTIYMHWPSRCTLNQLPDKSGSSLYYKDIEKFTFVGSFLTLMMRLDKLHFISIMT